MMPEGLKNFLEVNFCFSRDDNEKIMYLKPGVLDLSQIIIFYEFEKTVATEDGQILKATSVILSDELHFVVGMDLSTFKEEFFNRLGQQHEA